MKQRKPRKARNLVAKAVRECKLFAPKVIPAKKGKSVVYSRKSRSPELRLLSFVGLLTRGSFLVNQWDDPHIVSAMAGF